MSKAREQGDRSKNQSKWLEETRIAASGSARGNRTEEKFEQKKSQDPGEITNQRTGNP